MAFENVKIIDRYVGENSTIELKLLLATNDEVNAVEAKLDVSFPVGYKEYVTTLGFGEYCNYIRINMPSEILLTYKEYQQLLKTHWLWGMSEKVISKEKVLESIKIGDTTHGDSIIFHPLNSNEIVVIPRNDDMIHKIGSNLYEAIDWLCVYRHNPHSGSIGETHEKRYFIPRHPLVHRQFYPNEENL